MSSSPIITGSPSRYSSRYNNNVKDILSESPPRQKAQESKYVKNSPLQPNRTSEHKFFEGEKYSSFEIKNEDRGEWRETTKAVAVVDETTSEITRPASPSAPTPQQRRPFSSIPTRHQAITDKQRSATPPPSQKTTEKTTEKGRSLPHYMQATSAFQHRAAHQAKNDSMPRHQQAGNPLGVRSKGGIAKRVGTSKVPQYKSTTKINAIKDIQSEMTDEDGYVSMAARIQMFERGLGNGGRPTPQPSHSQQSRRSTTSTPTPSQSSTSKLNPITTPATSAPAPINDASVPRYARQTTSSNTKELGRRELKSSLSTANSSSQERFNPYGGNSQERSSQGSRSSLPKSSKPFHFATSERALLHEKSFNEKLKLWKEKDTLAFMNNSNNNNNQRKRKLENNNNSDPRNTKHYKY